MIKYIFKRILWMIPILFGVIVIVFSICHFMPGDPVLLMLDSDYTEEEYQLTAEKYGLDKPFLQQLFNYIKDFVLHGSLGNSYSTGRAVTKELSGRIWISVRLGLMSIFLTTIIAIPIGIISAIHLNSVLDYGVSFIAIFLASMPGFWVALMLIIVFCLQLKWFPAAGLNSWKSYVLPVLCNALGPLAITLRMTRSSMLEVIRQDYIRTARAKGLSEGAVIFHHVLQNGLIPVATIVGMMIGISMTGAIIVETIFNIPGLGTLMNSSISSKDYITVQGCVLICAFIVTTMNLLTDIAYAFIDPRIKAQYAAAGGSSRRKKKKEGEAA